MDQPPARQPGPPLPLGPHELAPTPGRRRCRLSPDDLCDPGELICWRAAVEYPIESGR